MLLSLTVALYPLSHLGFRDALQALLKSFDIAVEQYERQIGTHWYDLELVASDNLTLERIAVPLSGGRAVEGRAGRAARGPAPRGGQESRRSTTCCRSPPGSSRANRCGWWRNG